MINLQRYAFPALQILQKPDPTKGASSVSANKSRADPEQQTHNAKCDDRPPSPVLFPNVPQPYLRIGALQHKAAVEQNAEYSWILKTYGTDDNLQTKIEQGVLQFLHQPKMEESSTRRRGCEKKNCTCLMGHVCIASLGPPGAAIVVEALL
eukprot:s895_g22.t1